MLLWSSVRGHLIRAGLAVLSFSALACKADKVQPGGTGKDAGVEEILAPPILETIPESTPNATIAIRGTSTGKRVVVQGGSDGTSITSVLPGGSFCGDVGLKSGEPTALTVYTIGDGLLSEPIEVVVTRDATAPAPSNPTCSGSSPEQCDGPEQCANEIDDNCDGFIDNCDVECNQCVDDAFEPNDFDVNVPLVAAGTYNLAICPCREDWFAFERNMGQSIKITANFTHATIDLDMKLFKVSPTGTAGDLIATSASVTDQEVIDKVVDESTLYLLRVYPFGTTGTPSGPYELIIQ